MKVERILVQACCGRTNTIMKIDRPITAEFITALVAQGFHEAPNFTKAGILYADNLDFILTGALGQDRLHVKCKHSNCDGKLNELEGLLLQME